MGKVETSLLCAVLCLFYFAMIKSSVSQLKQVCKVVRYFIIFVSRTNYAWLTFVEAEVMVSYRKDAVAA